MLYLRGGRASGLGVGFLMRTGVDGCSDPVLISGPFPCVSGRGRGCERRRGICCGPKLSLAAASSVGSAEGLANEA